MTAPHNLVSEYVASQERLTASGFLTMWRMRFRAPEMLRGAALLARYLTPAERQQLLAQDYIEIKPPRSRGGVYRVTITGNVFKYRPDGTAICGYCVRPSMSLPIPDQILAYKWMLLTYYREWTKTAHRRPASWP